MRDLDKDYLFIKSHGYRIDTRGARFTLLRNTSASAYDRWEDALDAALFEIKGKAKS